MTDRPSPQEITGLLTTYGKGDVAAREKLLPLVYGELCAPVLRHVFKHADIARADRAEIPLAQCI